MSFRALTPKQATALLLAKKEALGISRLANLSPFVALKVCVVQAVRVTLVKGQVSATTGKGWNLQQALCGALGEALERYCAAHPPALEAMHYVLPRVEILTGWGHPDGFTPQDVCRAHELLAGRSCLLPAVDVHFPYHGPDLTKTPVRPHTSGLASGASLDEATLFGLFEVIERHASSGFFKRFRSAATGALIDANSIVHPRIRTTVDDLRHKGYETLIFRIDALLPAYYVAILDAANLGPKFMVAGVAAHIDECDALEGAFLEAMQAIVIAAQGAREDLIRFATSYREQEAGENNPFYRIRQLLARMNPTRAFPAVPNAPSQCSTSDALRYLLERLRTAGIGAVYRCDLSQPEWPLRVVKVIVPGMFDTHINPSRHNDATTTA
ncbi:ribosomal protein S12 methylthiotransferase accessory factor [Paraburkholderia sp. GAS199]|uniref:YcaO-like family protein n=1 Tax=Paraburkholderia sp. GAS199 TaxID=3035126 RepID=UPI003D25CD07